MSEENEKKEGSINKQFIIIAIIAIVITGGLFFKSKFMNDDKIQAIEPIKLTAAEIAQIKAPTEEEAAKYDAQAEDKAMVIETSYGAIKVKLYPKDAPYTVASFMKLADKGFYNRLTFHRVISGFMIQGGDPIGNGTGGPSYKFKDELNPATVSYKEGYKKGVLAMANSGPNTNGSQFFIMVADYPLPNNYTIFGKVISGQEVADAISVVAKDGNDKPLVPVKIKRVYVE